MLTTHFDQQTNEEKHIRFFISKRLTTRIIVVEFLPFFLAYDIVKVMQRIVFRRVILIFHPPTFWFFQRQPSDNEYINGEYFFFSRQ